MASCGFVGFVSSCDAAAVLEEGEQIICWKENDKLEGGTEKC